MIARGIVAALVASGLWLGAADSAGARDRIKVGLLDCRAAGGKSFIIGSTKRLRCEFRPSGHIAPEVYTGVIRKFGIDIGSTRDTFIRWVVFAPKTGMNRGALAGSYGGVSAEATIGVGLGANALIGGFDRSIALQPVSVQQQKGLNVAAGIASLRLDAR